MLYLKRMVIGEWGGKFEGGGDWMEKIMWGELEMLWGNVGGGDGIIGEGYGGF